MNLLTLDGGTYYHGETLHGPRFAGRFGRVLPALDATAADIAAQGTGWIIVPDRMNAGLLRRLRPWLLAHLHRGGTLVAFGENGAHRWLPQVEWSFRPTNFWWWLDPNASVGHRVVRPHHPLFRHVQPADTVWHFHGVLHPPAGAETLIALDDGHGALMIDDVVTTPGRLLLTTLDPFYHHGSHFMPATTRFLEGFLTWVAEETSVMA